ncbi:MAG: hypothetical protein K9W43_12045 [Candidatus Thorarchaeota archaeon]|nr:hypothetical protein [Candidatus Thorarchaeota archaeon]
MTERTKKGLMLAIAGALLFVFSFFLVLPVETLYIAALFLLFVAVILIGVGGALALGFDRSIDIPSEACYFCNGTGMVDAPDGGRMPCPRCGGTGISPDSYTDE